ncbi:MAG: hypothetical protein HY097_04115 [Nitrospinae bacterium]|nr:hypothetical protein [Nitrospinota bacterium]MBI3814831.1 hypothetical protein [Nitrospinota bacterium]
MEMILEIKNPEDGNWELFPILTVRDQDFRGGVKTAIIPGSVIEMRFVHLDGGSEDLADSEFSGRINSIRPLNDSGYYVLYGNVVNGQDVWEKLAQGLLR